MPFPNSKQFARLEKKGFGNFGTYYLDKGVSERVGKLIGVKTFDSGTIHEEHIIKHLTHTIIQAARESGDLPSWITSIDIVGSNERAQERGAIYQEHAEGITLDEWIRNIFGESEYTEKLASFINFLDCLLDFLSFKLFDLGIKVSDFQRDGIIVDKTIMEDLNKFFDSNPDGNFNTFDSRGKAFVNIDVGQWSIAEPGIQNPLSSHSSL